MEQSSACAILPFESFGEPVGDLSEQMQKSDIRADMKSYSCRNETSSRELVRIGAAGRTLGVVAVLSGEAGAPLSGAFTDSSLATSSVPWDDILEARDPFGPYLAACEAILYLMLGSGRSR